ncbi:MAG: IS256 family transposase, partial [bacterium]|nr:IS256 family transposase [bacterium]
MSTAEQLVQDEVTELVGKPWSSKGESPLRRGGRTKTRAFLDGEPVHIERPRVRDRDAGCEVPLETVGALTSRDALDDDVKRLLVRGISTRNYDAALTSLSDGLGLKRSAVSSAFQRASQKDLDA